ncbi:MAG: hypothetical protein ACOYL6_00955 [Bacteriovoracaceae bacterium]
MKVLALYLSILFSAQAFTAIREKKLVAVCETLSSKQVSEILVDGRNLKQLFTGSKSVSGSLLLVEEQIEMPASMRKAKGANIDLPLVSIVSNYFGNEVQFNLNLDIPTSQKIFVRQSYDGKDYSYEMTCELK